MKTTTKLSIRSLTTLPLLGLAAGTLGPLACTGEFKTKCPDGTVQQGGGDVDEVCVGAGAGGAGGWASAPAGGGGSSGVRGEGGGQTPVCAAGATRCANDAQETCGEGGQWGPAKACDIACDAAGSACVVPVQVAAAAGSACALLSDGTVRCWGDNRSGELGNGTDAGSLKPTPVAGVSNAVRVVGGGWGFCALGQDKSAACWGGNDKGQIAENPNGTNKAIKAPMVLGFAEVRDVAIGAQNICVVSGSSGASTVQCRGSNDLGQLGNGTTAPSTQFETVKGLPPSVRAVGVGHSHACAVSEQGETFCWGGGTAGKNGSPTKATVTEPIAVGGNASSGVLQLSLGYVASLAIRGDGALLLWGNVTGGDLVGSGESHEARLVSDVDTKILGASVHHLHACVIGEDGAVWCWGYSEHGETGLNCPEDKACESSPYVRAPRRLDVGWSAVRIASGSVGTCALTNASEIYCWGGNTVGQVGVGYASDYEAPSKVVWK